MLGQGWRGEVVGGGLEGEANPHEGEATSSSRNNRLVARDAVSVISAQRLRLMYRNRCRAATRSLSLSLSSQLLSDEERRSWRFRREHICHVSYTKRHGCVHVARSVPHVRNSRVLEAVRRRSEPAGCGRPARTVFVAGVVSLVARIW